MSAILSFMETYSRETDDLLAASKFTYAPSVEEVLRRALVLSERQQEFCLLDILGLNSNPGSLHLASQTIHNALTKLSKCELVQRTTRGFYVLTQLGSAYAEQHPRGVVPDPGLFASWLKEAASKGTLVRQYHSVNLQFQAKGIHAAVEDELSRGDSWRTNERAHSLVREERWDTRRVVIQIQRRTNTVNVQIRCMKPEEALRTDTQGFAYLSDYLGGIRGFLHAYGPDIPPSPEWVVVQMHLGVDCNTEVRLEEGVCITVREAQETFRIYDKSPSLVRFELTKEPNETLLDFARREIDFKENITRTLGQIDSTMSDFKRRLAAFEKRQLEAETSTSEVAKRLASVAGGIDRLAKFIEADRP